jgi:hypothetical protein
MPPAGDWRQLPDNAREAYHWDGVLLISRTAELIAFLFRY